MDNLIPRPGELKAIADQVAAREDRRQAERIHGRFAPWAMTLPHTKEAR